jgi:hypothetical protein
MNNSRRKRILLSGIIDNIQVLINSFKSKVNADNGTFEGESYCYTLLNSLKTYYLSFTLFVTANAFKTSKLYAIIPNASLGDLSYTRSSTATRVNQNGLIETMAANVPRIDWTYGFPVMLSETTATNLIPNSVLANSGGIPTGWSNNISTGTGGTATITPSGNSNVFVSGAGVTKYTFSVSGTVGTINALINRSVTVVSGSSYVISVRVESYSGNIRYNDIIYTIGQSSFAYFMNGVSVGLGNGLINQTGLLECRIITNSTTANIIYGLGMYGSINAGAGGTASIVLSAPQFEAGTYATSSILTPVGSTVTRTADSSNTTGLSSLIGQSEGTIYAEILITQITNDYLICALSLSGNSVTNSVLLSVNGAGRLVAQLYAAGVNVVNTVHTPFVVGNIYKVAFGYKSGNSVLFVNGVQSGATDTDVFTLTTLNAVSLVNTTYYVTGGKQAIKSIGLFPTRLSNSQLATLTT